MILKSFSDKTKISIYIGILSGIFFGVSLLIIFVKGDISVLTIGRFLGALIGGIFFGILFAFVQFKLSKDYFAHLENIKVTKNKAFDRYLKDSVVPKTENEKARLAVYMNDLEHRQNILERRAYPGQHSKLLLYATMALLFTVTLLNPNLRYLAALYLIVTSIGIYSEYKNKAMRRRIHAMRIKLNNS